MKISETGLDLIKSFEGCRLTAYQDSVGVWTIGWGHTKGVYKGQKITQAQADNLLKEDMIIYENKVNKYNNKYDFNQNQFDALTSFAYNIGSIDQLTANGTRTITQISNKILAYDKAGGKVLAGLTRRRKAEKQLFDTPIDTKEEVKMESSIEDVYSKPIAAEQDNSYQIRIATRTASALNVRKGPGTNYSIISTIRNNATVTITEEQNGWGKCDEGWINLDFTKKI